MIRVVRSAEARRHVPSAEIWLGMRTPGTEVPERVDAIEAALACEVIARVVDEKNRKERGPSGATEMFVAWAPGATQGAFPANSGKPIPASRDLGYADVRVRHHGAIARIELGANELPTFFSNGHHAHCGSAIKALGWDFVTIDVLGYKSGSMNALLSRDEEA